ncbi:MAG: MaoC family dehydratase N-terminal domain-containing protein [Mesorhizobium sp.]|nr:MaoC family dehydratase N-terminal domain-containing protein [Mesorhizobium sp.]MBN9245426.1 MaoC family dehydratase N-terminal domain-containing protein [Mesorhizobium sp.]
MSVGSIIGVRGPDFEVPIERGAIRQFARSLYSSHPDWMEARDAVVPPTFLVMAGYHWGYILERPPVGSPLADIDARGTTDGEQSFEFFGPPPRAGDSLVASTEVADHFFKHGRSGELEFFVMKTDFHDAADGRLVARWMPTSIRMDRRPKAAVAETTRERPWLKRGEARLELDQIGLAKVPLAIGGSAGAITVPGLTLTEMIRYQCASGEDSPGHHDTLAARAAGLPEFISVGMHHAGVLGAYAAHWLGPENVRAVRARFLSTVWPGDVLTYTGRVRGFGEREEGRTVELDLECLRDGVAVVKAQATFMRPQGL